ncbi:MAG: hypothetical protein QOE61_978 [Micromonosporaceae bacterium]|nr:hypothetical protein [Micromonosporaceae bacterium]
MPELRVATVFDAGDQAGHPYFSPDRRRVLDPSERGRLSRYLNDAPLALRAHGLEPDPLDPSRGHVVPVGYGTDGTWVWQEASGYYLDTYGVAPEDELVEHIEQAGYTPPHELPDEVLNQAADAALAPPVQRPPSLRRNLRYFASVTPGSPSNDPAGLFRQWNQVWHDGSDVRIDQSVGRDLRWHSTGAFVSNARNGEKDFVDISEQQAAAVLDRWLARWSTPQAGR